MEKYIHKSIAGDNNVVVAFVGKHCIYYKDMERPFLKLQKRYKGSIEFFELEGSHSFLGEDINNYPTYFLYSNGIKKGKIVGASIELLQKYVKKLVAGEDLDEENVVNYDGKIYMIYNKTTGHKYVGQTLQDVEKRWKQEASASGHNSELRALLQHKDTKKVVTSVNVCYGSNKYQVQDCMDHFERLTIKEIEANNKSMGGLNQTRGNQGRSAKLGKSYDACVVNKVTIKEENSSETSSDEEDSEEDIEEDSDDEDGCLIIMKGGAQIVKKCGKTMPCKCHITIKEENSSETSSDEEDSEEDTEEDADDEDGCLIIMKGGARIGRKCGKTMPCKYHRKCAVVISRGDRKGEKCSRDLPCRYHP